MTTMRGMQDSLGVFTNYLGFSANTPLRTLLESGPGPYTVFAPNNAAMNQPGGPDPSDAPLLLATFQYHVVNGAWSSSNLLAGDNFVTTLLTQGPYTDLPQALNKINRNGDNLVLFWSTPGYLFSPNVIRSQSNVACTNGILHVIDRVMSFPLAANDMLVFSNWTTFLTAVRQANLEALLTTPGITIYAPTNEAWAGLNWQQLSTAALVPIIQMHFAPTIRTTPTLMNGTSIQTVLPGAPGRLTAIKDNLSNLIYIDFMKSYLSHSRSDFDDILVRNGVLHSIDRVMIPYLGGSAEHEKLLSQLRR